MIALLDVNVLIALLDRLHTHHRAAQQWFQSEGRRDWASCPLTENGFLRIVGHRRYLNSPGSPAVLVPLLTDLRKMGRHRFWPDDISLLDSPLVDPREITSDAWITDSYLLALARTHGGRLATFDSRLRTHMVKGGAETLLVIPST